LKGNIKPLHQDYNLKQKVLDDLTSQIKDGSLPPGSRLFGMRTLCSHYNVSYAVINAAYNELVANGLIIRYPSKGTFVNPTLKFHNTKIVALITTYRRGMIEDYFDTFLEVASKHNILPLVTMVNADNWRERLHGVLERLPDLVLTDLDGKTIPIYDYQKNLSQQRNLYINRWEWSKSPPNNAILLDYTQAYVDALTYLKERGARRIILMEGNQHEKIVFWEKRLKEVSVRTGMKFGKDIFRYSWYDLKRDPESLKALYDTYSPDACFGIADYLLIKLIEQAQKYCPKMLKLDFTGIFHTHHARHSIFGFASVPLDFISMWEKALQWNECKQAVYIPPLPIKPYKTVFNLTEPLGGKK
jgi:DNA-binding transcriptional regulator YhcF (GntR family)